jgi:hypothetical protein
MSSLKLMRCELRKRGTRGPGTIRYVPLEIFGLWEHLMSNKHDFEIVTPRASLWLDMEDQPEAAYGESQFERVTEVTAFVYSERDEMFTRARRYFRADESESLKRIFLSHYDKGPGSIQPQVREKTGIWLVRDSVAASA